MANAKAGGSSQDRTCLSCARTLAADEGDSTMIGWVQVTLCGPRCQSDLETALGLSELPCISTGCGAESIDGSQCEQHLYQAA